MQHSAGRPRGPEVTQEKLFVERGEVEFPARLFERDSVTARMLEQPRERTT
jgi:hypothetical protein